MLSRSLSRYQAVAPAAAARLSTAVRAATAGGQAAADALNAPLSATDPELFDIIEHEKLRQARSPRLTLSRALIYQQTPRAHTSHLRNPGRRQLGRRALRLVRISSLEAVAGPHVHIRAPGVRMPCAHISCSPNAPCSQRNSLVLIPSENYTSKSVLDALGSVMSNKYSVRTTRYTCDHVLPHAV